MALASHLPAPWQLPAILVLDRRSSPPSASPPLHLRRAAAAKKTLTCRHRRSRRPTRTLIACPILWKPLLAGFILFRVFDIVKPSPIRRLENLPEGTGIVVDDLGAGVYGLIVLQLLLHFHLLGPR